MHYIVQLSPTNQEKHKTPNSTVLWRTGYTIWARKDDLHFKLLHQKSGKISKTWVHTARLKPANPRPAYFKHDSNEAITDLGNHIHKPLKPNPIIHNGQISALHVSSSEDSAMKHDQSTSPGVKNTPNHSHDLNEEKPFKLSRMLAKKLNMDGEWLYRVSFMELDVTLNKWISHHDMPQCLKTLVRIAGKKIKIRKTNRSADNL